MFPIEGGSLVKREVGGVKAVNDVSFQVRFGESLGIVGESGCGKSTTARLVMRLLEPTSGTIKFDGQDITHLRRRELRLLRARLQIVFQDPYASLNPRMDVEAILSQPFRIHRIYKRKETLSRIRQVLDLVGLPKDCLSRYPNEFSGGQRQRLGIARALCLKPSMLILDEPVSALDVSIQAQILNLLRELKAELGLSYLIIAHDLSVVRHVSDRVAVMYLGSIVESADRDNFYASPLHPYSEALLSAVPVPEPVAERNRVQIVLGGDPPSPANPPLGCGFNPRCWKAADICVESAPPLAAVDGGPPSHLVACRFPAPVREVLRPSAG